MRVERTQSGGGVDSDTLSGPRYRGRVLDMSVVGSGMALQIGFSNLQLQP